MTAKEVEQWRWRSFEKLLEYICQRKNPVNVLEWGPGHSTHIILNHALSSQILSIEHHPVWFKRAQDRFQTERVELVHRTISPKGGMCDGYSNYPLWRAVKAGGELSRYDLVFVDGRHRFDCLMTAMMLVKDTGVVIIHDSGRAVYKPAIEAYPYFQDFPDIRTAVMSKRPLGYLRWFEQGEIPKLDDGW